MAAEYVELNLLTSVYLTNHWAAPFEVSGNYAYLARQDGEDLYNGVGGIIALDITHPDSPVFVGSILLRHSVFATASSGSRLFALSCYVTDSPEGRFFMHHMDVIDTQNPLQLTTLGSYGMGIYNSEPRCGVYLLGEYAIITAHTNLLVLDISDTAKIRPVALLNVPEGLYVLAFEGNYAYGIHHSEVAVYDFTTPSAPRILSQSALPLSLPFGELGTACVKDGIGYFGWGFKYIGGWIMVDVRNPKKPVLLGEFSTPCQLTSITIAEGFAYLAPHHRIEVFDISDPLHVALVGRSREVMQATGQARLSGDHLFVRDSDELKTYRIEQLPAITRHSITSRRLDLQWNDPAKGMKLQRTTSLANPDWQSLLGSENTNSVSLPIWGESEFFRLIKP